MSIEDMEPIFKAAFEEAAAANENWTAKDVEKILFEKYGVVAEVQERVQ